jgi:hypothetical protein
MSIVSADAISAALKHAASPVFLHPRIEVDIGPTQSMEIDGKGQSRTLYELQGDTTNLVARMFEPTAILSISDAAAFHGALELGSFASVVLGGVSATSYTFNAERDQLRLYQGNRVVGSYNVASAAGAVIVQSQLGWTMISTGFTGNSGTIPPHT